MNGSVEQKSGDDVLRVECNGSMMTVSEIAKLAGTSRWTIYKRIRSNRALLEKSPSKTKAPPNNFSYVARGGLYSEKELWRLYQGFAGKPRPMRLRMLSDFMAVPKTSQCAKDMLEKFERRMNDGA